MKFTISGSSVSAECEVKDTESRTLFVLHLWALHLIRGLIDSIAFSRAWAVGLILDSCILPGESPRPVGFRDDELAARCTVSLDDIMLIADKERGVLKHLHDLTDSLIDPLESQVNCARAVEGLCRLMSSSDADKKMRWKFMQESLNLSQQYLEFITEVSKERRHGSIDPNNLAEIARDQASRLDGG